MISIAIAIAIENDLKRDTRITETQMGHAWRRAITPAHVKYGNRPVDDADCGAPR